MLYQESVRQKATVGGIIGGVVGNDLSVICDQAGGAAVAAGSVDDVVLLQNICKLADGASHGGCAAAVDHQKRNHAVRSLPDGSTRMHAVSCGARDLRFTVCNQNRTELNAVADVIILPDIDFSDHELVGCGKNNAAVIGDIAAPELAV